MKQRHTSPWKPSLKPTEVKEKTTVVVLRKFQEFDEILANMKDDPEGKKGAVEKEFELLPVILEKVLSGFVAHIKERAEAGCIFIPTVDGQRIWKKSFDAYLKDAAKIAAEEERIRSSPGFRKMMNTPAA